MPWYVSYHRIMIVSACCATAARHFSRIVDAEDRYSKSLTWVPAVAVIYDHRIVANKLGSSMLFYRFTAADGKVHRGKRIRSGGMSEDEILRDPTLLGIGTELIVYYNPADPEESALKLQRDRTKETIWGIVSISLLGLAYRALRCEHLIPPICYRVFSANRRVFDQTGVRQQRGHAFQKSKFRTPSSDV